MHTHVHSVFANGFILFNWPATNLSETIIHNQEIPCSVEELYWYILKRLKGSMLMLLLRDVETKKERESENRKISIRLDC